MNHHEASHDGLLRAFLSGEHDAPAAELEACAVCRERLRERHDAIDTLDAAAAEQRAVLLDAATIGPAPGEEHVARLVRDGLRARRSSPRTPWAWLALAAALLVGLLLWSQQRTPDDGGSSAGGPPTDRLLRAGDFGPTGRDVQDLTGGFWWPRVDGADYVLYVYHPSDALNPRWTISCDANEWLPTAADSETLRADGPHWLWQVEVLPGDGEPRLGELREFWLSR